MSLLFYRRALVLYRNLWSVIEVQVVILWLLHVIGHSGEPGVFFLSLNNVIWMCGKGFEIRSAEIIISFVHFYFKVVLPSVLHLLFGYLSLWIHNVLAVTICIKSLCLKSWCFIFQQYLCMIDSLVDIFYYLRCLFNAAFTKKWFHICY